MPLYNVYLPGTNGAPKPSFLGAVEAESSFAARQRMATRHTAMEAGDVFAKLAADDRGYDAAGVLRHQVTGAIARGEASPIAAQE